MMVDFFPQKSGFLSATLSGLDRISKTFQMLAEFAVYQLNSVLVREGKYASFLMERKRPKQSSKG